MSDKLSSLYQKLYNTPHLMTTELFGSIQKSIPDSDISADIGQVKWKSDIEDLQYNAETGVGILPVVGLLTYEESGYWWMDTTSYKSLLSDTEVMIEAGAETIVLDLDSGGGYAYSMTQTSSEIRKLCDDNGVKLIAYNDGIAASACYGLGCAAHEFIVNPDALTGSIGVVVSITDTSAYEKKMGIKRIYITAGEGKVPYDEEGSFSKEALADIQTRVDATYERFTSHVAKYRKVTPDQVKALGAKVYSSAEAVANGLADKEMTREEFFNYLADIVEQGKPPMALSIFSKKTKATITKETEMSVTEADVQAQLAFIKEEMTAAFASQIADFQAKAEVKLAAVEAEKAEMKAALEAVQKEKQEAKATARLAELSALLGDTESTKLNQSLSSLDDTAFAVVVASLVAKADKQEAEMTKEIGSEGKVVVTEPVEYSATVQKNMQEFLTNQSKKKGAK